MKEKCIIFGASKSGKAAYRLLKEKYEVIGFADNASEKWETFFCDKKVFNPAGLIYMEKIEIIIASVYYAIIHKQLIDIGIDNENIKVFFYRGSAADNNSNSYNLYKLSGAGLFSSCIFNSDKIEKIQENFQENYCLDTNIKKIILNKTIRKKVLFCAYIFPPIGGSGVQRSLKFVKYLRSNGYEPVVLTVGKNDGKIVNDFSMLQDIPSDITIIRIDNKTFLPEFLSLEEQQEIYNLYCGMVQSEDWMKRYIKIINSIDARLIPDNKLIWVNECLKMIAQKINMDEIDIVFTTGNPFSTFFLGYYLKKRYGIKWVQDYRDPWMNNQFYLDNYYKDDKLTFGLQMQLEKKLTQLADAIIVVGKSLKKDYTEKYGISSEKLFEITNGYDEDDFNNIEINSRNDKFTICYNGTVYIDRNPVELLEIINGLIDIGQIEMETIQWNFNGNIEEYWKNKIINSDRYGIVKYNGYLSHIESIKNSMGSDMLVLFGTETGYTGKIFEYIRMNKPILSLSPSSNDELSYILDNTMTGKNFIYNDKEKIKDFILDYYNKWKNKEKDFVVNYNEIKKYSREHTTALLADIFTKVLEE